MDSECWTSEQSDGYSSLPIGTEWSTMLRVPDKDEKLRMRSIKTASEDGGVTVDDVVIVGEDDAPVLSLNRLRLKAMEKYLTTKNSH